MRTAPAARPTAASWSAAPATARAWAFAARRTWGAAFLDVETLDVRPSGTLRVSNGATLVKTRAAQNPGTMSLSGVLDLAGGSFLSRAGGPALTTYRDWCARGFNAGAWNGTNAFGAINSSLAAGGSPNDAVGYGLGSEIAVTSIGGYD